MRMGKWALRQADPVSQRTTTQEILAEVKRLQPWFHCIDLGDSIKTKTVGEWGEPADHPLPTWKIISACLPADLTGKTVLDVGCNAGFYSVAAKRRNASRVLGVDAQRAQVRQARFVRRVLGLDIDYQRISVYDLDPRQLGQFDITLALGLIYHCKHLVLALEKLFHITKTLLILETAVLPQKGNQIVHNLGPETVLHSLACVENAPSAKEQVYNWFIPSVGAIVALLRNVGFQDIELFSEDGGRAVLMCRKPSASENSRDLSNLGASLRFEDARTQCAPGEELIFHIRVENTGAARWLSHVDLPPAAPGVVRLGCHLLGPDQDELFWDYGGADLPHQIAPGNSAILAFHVRAPEAKGSYWLEFEMVAEHLSWFEDLGSPSLKSILHVE